MSVQLDIRSYSGAGRHAHDHVQVLVPMRGAMQLDVEGRSDVVASQCVAVIPGLHVHDFVPSPDCSLMVLDVELDAFAAAAPRLARAQAPLVSRLDPFAWRLFHMLGAEATANARRAREVAALALAGLQLVTPQPARSRDAAARVAAFACGGGRGMAVGDMAAGAGLGQSQFHALFRAATGQSPKQHQLTRLFDQAADMLAHTDEPISEIAYRLGYRNVSSFNRQFKRRFGTTPSLFRAAGLDHPAAASAHPSEAGDA